MGRHRRVPARRRSSATCGRRCSCCSRRSPSVLLIACANVVSLMLARGVARSRELAVRAAVGATAGRLLRQQIVESLLVAMLGGGAGLALASWALRVAPGRGRAAAAAARSRRARSRASWLAALGHVARVRRSLTGLLPAWKASRQSGAAALRRRHARRPADTSRARQAIVFVADRRRDGAGGRRRAADPQLRSADARAVRLQRRSHAAARTSRCRRRATRATARAPFFDRALERIRALPGVQAAGAGGPLPLSGQDGLLRFGVAIEGRDADAGSPGPRLPALGDAGLFHRDGHRAAGRPSVRRRRRAPTSTPVARHRRGAGAPVLRRRGSRSAGA